MRPSLRLALSFGLLALAACGGAVEPVPDPTPSTSSTSPPSTSAAEKTGGSKASGSASGGAARCDGRPECDLGDTKVPDESGCHNDGPNSVRCYSREACGEQIWCTGPACTGPRPTCLPGWEQVDTCPQDVACTTVTFCGESISCVDTAAPPGGG